MNKACFRISGKENNNRNFWTFSYHEFPPIWLSSPNFLNFRMNGWFFGNSLLDFLETFKENSRNFWLNEKRLLSLFPNKWAQLASGVWVRTLSSWTGRSQGSTWWKFQNWWLLARQGESGLTFHHAYGINWRIMVPSWLYLSSRRVIV